MTEIGPAVHRQGAARCRSCQAPVVWAITSSGRRIPLDATPTPAGNITLRPGTPPVAVVTGNDDTDRYTSHFATCPQAKQWRRQ